MNTYRIIFASAALFVLGFCFVAAQGNDEATLAHKERYSDVEALDISGVEFAVVVQGEDRSDVELAIYTEEPQRIEITRPRTRLRIVIRSRLSGAVFGAAANMPQGRIEIKVPRDMDAIIRTASGSIEVEGLSGAREININSASGAVTLEQSRGDIEINTASGRVSVWETKGRVLVDTASGRIDLVDTEGSISAESASGGIHGRGVLLTADSQFRSVSGGIRVDLANDLDDLRFRTRSVSGTTQIGSSRGKDLEIGDGPITVFATTTSGSQVFE